MGSYVINTIKILTLNPGESELQVKEIDNTLKELQSIVGGYIEVVNIGNNCIIICNEEGKILNLKPNILFGNDVIVGTIIFSKFNDEGEFISLDDEDIEFIKNI